MKELEPHPTGEDWRWDQTDFFDFLDLPFFRGFGFAFMSTSIACSKLNGKSDPGLAFGMRPPWASGVGRSSLCISSEHSSLRRAQHSAMTSAKMSGFFP